MRCRYRMRWRLLAVVLRKKVEVRLRVLSPRIPQGSWRSERNRRGIKARLFIVATLFFFPSLTCESQCQGFLKRSVETAAALARVQITSDLFPHMEEVWFQSDMIQMDALFNAYTLLLDIRLRIIYGFFFDTMPISIPWFWKRFQSDTRCLKTNFNNNKNALQLQHITFHFDFTDYSNQDFLLIKFAPPSCLYILGIKCCILLHFDPP